MLTPDFIKTSKFEDIAEIILNNYLLTIKNKKYRLCEIEFYKNDDSHPDTYTHANPDQKTFGKFYFHKYKNNSYKSGTYKGMDLTFGNEKCYFGVLIRSLLDIDTNEFIEGPCRCVNKLLEIMNCKTVSDLKIKDLISFDDPNISFTFVNNFKKEKVFKGPRVGLSDKYPEYKLKKYRFVTHLLKIKKQKIFEPVEYSKNIVEK